MYDELAHSSQYAAFEGRQLGAALGANAWGKSFVVGAGSTFPHCMQHQVANLSGSRMQHQVADLSGSLDGSPPIVRGAAVNGPNDVPGGVTALSVGLSLAGDGRLAADDLALVGASA
jgi:endoglucanase